MGSVAKAIAAFFTSLGTWGATSLADGHLDGVEWFGLCGVVVATVAVWGVTNTARVVPPPLPIVKRKAKSAKGQIGVGELLLIVVVVLLILLLVGGVPNR